MGLTAPDNEADNPSTGTACDRLGSPDPDRPATHDTKNRVRAVTWADRVHPDNTHTGPVRKRRDGADRVGPDRTGVPIITASQEEPTAEVHLAPNPGPDGAGTYGAAFDPSVFGRPEIAGHPGSPPALPPTASGPHRRRGQRRNTIRTDRKWTEREAGDSVGPGRSQQPHTGPRTTLPPDGDRLLSNHTDGVGPAAPTNRADGTRKQRRDGETRSTLERTVATRTFLDTYSVAELLGVEKVRGLNETSEDLSGPSS